MGSIPGSGRSPGEGNGNPLQYCCLGSLIDRGAWQATVHGVTTESDTTEWLNTACVCVCVCVCLIVCYIYTQPATNTLMKVPEHYFFHQMHLISWSLGLTWAALSIDSVYHWWSKAKESSILVSCLNMGTFLEHWGASSSILLSLKRSWWETVVQSRRPSLVFPFNSFPHHLFPV